jgi:hypothetical protein
VIGLRCHAEPCTPIRAIHQPNLAAHPVRAAGVKRASRAPDPRNQRVLAGDAPEGTITTVLRMSLKRFAAHP